MSGWALIGSLFSRCAGAPLLSAAAGGLLAIEGILLGLVNSQRLRSGGRFEVILLLMFMVAGICFTKDLLLFVFTKILLNVRSKKLLAFLFSIVAAIVRIFGCTDGDGRVD